MAYICKDCSYRGKQGGQLGGCPACGSFNVVLKGASRAEVAQPPGNIRLALLVVTWAVFLGLVVWKLFT
ncbi:hypothetical protein [Parahaliea mediterranea]|uniref:Uncharacterized protein n=1 Tax=Parahaliea mediterranea TaxID=651086 RepID=A0A939DHB5_9GAMM|nr:hypothetical protein [Parahaliea mediterranea]MBN7798263.1 hypothetical protein [Parahaliea mediterranea]